MECQHLDKNIKIKPEKLAGHSKVWKCEECRTTDSPWLCLNCGYVGCGRYVSAHAKRHHEEREGHAICIDCRQLSVFCYQCDDFIFNDTASGIIDKVRVEISRSVTGEHCDSRPSSGRKRKRNRLAQSESEGEAENRQGKRRLRRRGHSAEPQPTQRTGCAAGLRNLGNTCFMNAVLQSLNNIQEFRSYMSELPDLADIIKERSQNGRTRKASPGQVTRSTRDLNGELMTEELRKVLVELSTSSSAISPEALFHVIWKVVPRFRGYQQQDAHEFLRYMLDRLHTEMLALLPEVKEMKETVPAARDSIVTAVFGGTLQNEVTCLICRTESRKHDPFLDLSLDIPDRFLQLRGKSSKDADAPPACTLADCLKLFLDVEELADTELYYCSSCKQRQKSTKKFWLRRLPNVLCVHVKRFRWCNNYRTKVDVPLLFPVRALDMSAHLLGRTPGTRRSGTVGSQLYDLAAVIVHHGTGAGSGHYTAFASHAGSWYHFNDSTVKKADEEQVAKCKAYILFYIRREFKLPKLTS